MLVTGVVDRDVEVVRLPRWGRVSSAEGSVPWLVLDDDGVAIEPIRVFLRDFVARGNRPGSIRSYAFGLLRWWRWLRAVGVEWDRATSAEVRDLVLWLRMSTKPAAGSRTRSLTTAGTVNAVTGKRYLDDNYAPRTIRHSNAVVGSFYDFWIEAGSAPLVNPVSRQRVSGRRPNGGHNPMQSFRPEGRLRYNPKLPRQRPRTLSDEQWVGLFAALRSHRDRALLALAISNGARANELLGLRACDLNWGEQLVRVFRKGSGAEQWLPASSEAFVWLRLYFTQIATPAAKQSIWCTLRRRDRGEGLNRQPVSYDALRAVLRRANDALGANWSMHDLRHTCATRMAHDEQLSLRDVQTILGHAHLSTTVDIYLLQDEREVIARVAAHLADKRDRHLQPPVAAVGYDAADMDVLFARNPR